MHLKAIRPLAGLFLPALLLLTLKLHATDLPPGFAEVTLANGLNPTAMALAPDGSLFLAQKDGRVLIVHADGSLHDEPFVHIAVDAYNERGLCGIALHPNFEQEPWVYLYYSIPGANRNRISRILANGDFAMPGSEQVLLDLDILNGFIHNGGAMVFGPDENLYISTGDGANPSNAQNPKTVLGKILRITATGTIPEDNPFYAQSSGNNRAIYALGVRNPFSMSTDPLSGRIFFCDVGNGAWEEVNEVLPGKNYGWSLIEGPQAGQALPGNYQDPLYAYPHSEGCAVVGAAFGFSSHPAIPAAYQGLFYYADYCSGWIRALDPATGDVAAVFATGIDRPVSLLITPNGALYYYARAGLGGGSPDDNTASAEGTLRKVFWTGSGTPLITGQPRNVLVSEGETAVFQVDAFGAKPIHYQWLVNGIPVSGVDSSLLELPNLTIADSGKTILCRVENAYGNDTSQPAMLHVTQNHRPLPEILFPSANAVYRCGDTLHFTGHAIDPEDGTLPAKQLSWRIDFHHADHTHPALSQTTGISEGVFPIPVVGETATDVFFRVYLTATDTTGLGHTVWQDVKPVYTSFSIDGPAGGPINVDGQIRSLPVTAQSVVGIERTVQASLLHVSGDTTYHFSHWADNQSTDPVRSFRTLEVPLSLEAIYGRYAIGNGTGLQGAYFFDPEGDLDEDPVLIRRDTTIDFYWNEGSPDPQYLPDNYFTIRWTGFVQPLFSDTYNFHVLSDDGSRLWIGDSLIIDKWNPQAAIEHTGAIPLQSGAWYPIRLEYLEIAGGAQVELRWSSTRQPKEIVPRRQLYLPDSVGTATLTGVVGLDLDQDGAWEPGETVLPGAVVSLYQAATDSLLGVRQTSGNGSYQFLHLRPDSYYLHIVPPPTSDLLKPGENLESNGYTAVFDLADRETRVLNAAWEVVQAGLYGLVWLDENRNDLWDITEPGLKDILVSLYRSDSTFIRATSTDEHGGYLFPLIEPNTYFLWFSDHLAGVPLAPGTGLSEYAATPAFDMEPGKSREIVVAFKPALLTATKRLSAQHNDLSVWPNPAIHTIQAGLTLPGAGMVKLTVLSPTGQQVFSSEQVSTAGINTWTLPVHQLNPGVYTLVVRTATGVRTKRWVKIR
ncbi:MAG: T9SS type A sorting domain-containing protein [Bacteroidetes bacterium]|nr:MAG: T9SS type A sorting domain-containing protein [Bacteroidota bacterium]